MLDIRLRDKIVFKPLNLFYNLKFLLFCGCKLLKQRFTLLDYYLKII